MVPRTTPQSGTIGELLQAFCLEGKVKTPLSTAFITMAAISARVSARVASSERDPSSPSTPLMMPVSTAHAIVWTAQPLTSSASENTSSDAASAAETSAPVAFATTAANCSRVSASPTPNVSAS